MNEFPLCFTHNKAQFSARIQTRWVVLCISSDFLKTFHLLTPTAATSLYQQAPAFFSLGFYAWVKDGFGWPSWSVLQGMPHLCSWKTVPTDFRTFLKSNQLKPSTHGQDAAKKAAKEKESFSGMEVGRDRQRNCLLCSFCWSNILRAGCQDARASWTPRAPTLSTGTGAKSSCRTIHIASKTWFQVIIGELFFCKTANCHVLHTFHCRERMVFRLR